MIVFTWLDLVFPLGLPALFLGLCVWALARVQNDDLKKWPKRTVLSLVMLVMIAQPIWWYVVRYTAWKVDYVTLAGVRVHTGKINKCDKVDIVRWEQELILLWAKHDKYACDPDTVKQALKDTFLVCVDQEKLSLGERFVKGYSNSKVSVIGWNPQRGKVYVKSLYRHEESHIIARGCGHGWDGDKHHAMFREMSVDQATLP